MPSVILASGSAWEASVYLGVAVFWALLCSAWGSFSSKRGAATAWRAIAPPVSLALLILAIVPYFFSARLEDHYKFDLFREGGGPPPESTAPAKVAPEPPPAPEPGNNPPAPPGETTPPEKLPSG